MAAEKRKTMFSRSNRSGTFPSYSRPARPKFKNLFAAILAAPLGAVDRTTARRTCVPPVAHVGFAMSQALLHLNSLKETVTVILVCDSFAVAHYVAPKGRLHLPFSRQSIT